MVCRLSSRDRWRRLPGAGGRAYSTCRGLAASDTVTGVNRPIDCSNAADKPINAETMPTLVLPPSLDPSRWQGHLIDAAASGRLDIKPPTNCIQNTCDQPGDRSN